MGFGRSCLGKAALTNRLFNLIIFFPPKLAFNGEVQAERLPDQSRAACLELGREREELTHPDPAQDEPPKSNFPASFTLSSL